MTVTASSGGIGGRIEFRADAPDGALLGSVDVLRFEGQGVNR